MQTRNYVLNLHVDQEKKRKTLKHKPTNSYAFDYCVFTIFKTTFLSNKYVRKKKYLFVHIDTYL